MGITDTAMVQYARLEVMHIHSIDVSEDDLDEKI